jgi:DNA-binding XRE family transcriptional regulator
MDRKNQIRRLAAENNITIAKLAVEIGVQPHTLRRYTRHEAEPRLELCEKIANRLGCTIDEVLNSPTSVAPAAFANVAIGISEDELMSMPPKLLADLQIYLKSRRPG